MPLIIGFTQYSDQIINCTMADFVISTNDSHLYGTSVNFKSSTYESFDSRALISRLIHLYRPLIISCAQFNNHMINGAMADFAVYNKFCLARKFQYPNFNKHFAQWKDTSLLINDPFFN